MGRRRARREPGRPTLLDAEVEKKLIQATELGTPMGAAAEYCGISKRAFEDWMRRGHIEQGARDDGEEPNPVEQKYLDLYERIMEARAKATFQSAALIRKSAIGGQVTEETTRRYRDHNGEVVEEKTVKRTAPDWKAAAWWLERQMRSDFGRETKVTQEINGKVEMAVHVESLAQQVTDNIAQLQAEAMKELEGRDPASDDIVDGELVDE